MAGLQRERSHGLPDSWLHQNGRRASMQDGQLSQFEQPKLKITLLCLKVDGLGSEFTSGLCESYKKADSYKRGFFEIFAGII